MTAFSTPLSRRLGLRYPLAVAPMFIISNKEMVVACAEAGILGAMPSLNSWTSEEFEQDLRWIRSKTDRAFAINMTIGLTAPARIERDLALCLEYEVPVMVTSYGDPSEIVVDAHAKNITVFHDVINLKHAKKAEAAGVDAIIGVSHGAGGHAGRVNPFVLVPHLKRNLSIPVVAAGCISGGAQVAAALALGADLAYMGTRFIASTECGAEARYKELVVASTHEDIIYTDKVSGIHANFIASTVPDDYDPGRGPEAAQRWTDIWSAGQGVTLIDEVKPIAEIVEDIVREYHDAVAAR